VKSKHRLKPRDEVRRNMQAIRSSENAADVALRRALHRGGLRFRKYTRTLVGTPDIVFSAARVAVFVDGDFWHARVLREHGEHALVARLAHRNLGYWIPKFRRRIERDSEVSLALTKAGWKVMRLWESDVLAGVERVATKVARIVRSRVSGVDR